MNIHIEPYYRPPQKDLWQGRKDNEKKERFYQAVTLKTFTEFLTQPSLPEKISEFIVGFACDEGVLRNQGRIGAQQGPQALRQALANLAFHHFHQPIPALIDLGDVICPDKKLEQAQAALAYVISKIIDQNGFPIVLGGGHETAWGHYQGLSPRLEKSNFAIVNFDAHFDMRPLVNQQGNSGTSFLQIAQERQAKNLPFHYYCLGIQSASNTQTLFNIAQQWQVNYLLCDQMYAFPQGNAQFIHQLLTKHDHIYLTLCLDVFAASVAPGVSAASPYGLQPAQVLPLLRQLAQSGKVIALDVVELAPSLDRDQLTAKLGALCIAEFLSHRKVTHG